MNDLLVPQEGKNSIPEKYTIRCNCSKLLLSAAPVEKTTCLAPHSETVAVA